MGGRAKKTIALATSTPATEPYTAPAPSLRFTGHPLADVAMATVCTMTRRIRPEEVTLEDLDRVADEIERHYFGPAFMSFVICVFMNAAYTNSSSSEDNKAKFRREVVRAHRASPDPRVQGMRCALSGLPATFAATRTHVPMLTAEDQANFYPAGRTFLPLAGAWVTALQALPFGARRCHGWLLAAWSDEPKLLFGFARRFLDDNRRYLALANSPAGLPAEDRPDAPLERGRAVMDTKTKRGKYPDAKRPSTLLLHDLQDLLRDLKAHSGTAVNATVTAYHLTNSGQGPDLKVLHVPSAMVRFLSAVNAAPHGPAWQRLVARGWRAPTIGRPKKGAPAQTLAPGPGVCANRLLEDLHRVYELDWPDRGRAAQFVRRHLLPRRADVAAAGSFPAVAWTITDLFLREVLGMDRTKIDAIRTLADRLAQCVHERNDRRLFRDVVYARKARDLRGAIGRAQRRMAEKNELLVTMEQFVQALVDDDSLGRFDWSLARDLLAVRMIEALHGRGWFEDHQDALEEDEQPEGEASDVDATSEVGEEA